MQTAAERVQNRNHLGEPNSRFAPFQLDEEANPNAGRGSQLVLPQALCKPGLSNDGPDFFRGHLEFPIGKSITLCRLEVDFYSRSGVSKDIAIVLL